MIRVSKHDRNCSGRVILPASKSISNRLLILQYFYGNDLIICNLSEAEDTILLSSILDLLKQYQLKGESGLLRIDTRNVGTIMRFLVPLLSVSRGHFLLTGTERMKQRPIGALVQALRATGAEIDYLEQAGFPPLIIRGRPVSGSRISVDGTISSQFVTALLILAPTLENGLTIDLTGIKSSWPYVTMTTGLLSKLGVQVIIQEDAIRVYHKNEIKTSIEVESDWSSAAFWYAMLSLADTGEIFFPGLKRSGLQGDQQLAVIFQNLGILTHDEKSGIRITKTGESVENFYADFSDYPDLALPVIMACGLAGKKASFTGLENLRVKESDRLEALTACLLQAGLELKQEFPGTWRLSGHLKEPYELYPDDYEDHRVAMTLACLAMKGFSVNIENADVVNKSYPSFWNDLESVGFRCDRSC